MVTDNSDDHGWYLQKVIFDGCDDSLMVKLIALWREKVRWYFRDIDSENIYAKNIENKEIVNLWLEGFMVYL